MADPIPLPAVKVLPSHRWRHGILTAVLAVGLVAGLAASRALQGLVPPMTNHKVGVVSVGLVIAATFLFTVALVWGPYRRGLVYQVAKGTLPPGATGEGDAARLARAYGTWLSVAWGLVCASGLVNAVAYAVRGSWASLAVAAGCLVLLVRLAPRQAACARFVRDGEAALPGLRAGP
jgi:hypothetical protein